MAKNKLYLTHGGFLLVSGFFIWWGFASQNEAIYGRDRFAPWWWFGGIFIIFGGMIAGAVTSNVVKLLKGKHGKK